MNEFSLKLFSILYMVVILKMTCVELCTPPKKKSERAYFSIVRIEGTLMEFCRCTDTRYIDEKLIGFITVEGFRISRLLMLCYSLIAIMIILGDLRKLYFPVLIITLIAVVASMLFRPAVVFFKRRAHR